MIDAASWHSLHRSLQRAIGSNLSTKERKELFEVSKEARDLRALDVCADVTLDFAQRDFRFFDELKRDCKTIHTVTVHHLEWLTFEEIGHSGGRL